MKKTNKKRKKKRLVPRIIALLLTVFILCAGYARYIEPSLIITHRDTIKTEVFDDPSGIRIALFADTHFSENYTPEDFEKAVKRINKSDPDIVFFLGDLVDDYENYTGDISQVIQQLSYIEAPLGKFAVYGNHDYGGNMEFEYPDIMQQSGFRLLLNEYVVLEDKNIGILGVDDILIGYGDPACASSMRSDLYNIVLCHEPDIVDDMLQYDIDLMLSGHTHGRQIDISLFDELILPPYGKNYIKGLYSFDNTRGTQLFVTSGLGTTKIAARFMTIPEVNILKVK